MHDQALMAAVQLMDSGDETEQVVGILILQRHMMDELDEEEEELVLALAAIDSGPERLPAPYLLRREDAPECALDMWMLLEETPFWWDTLFRFTAVQFFYDLLPALHLPRYFQVSGHKCEAGLAVLMLLARLSAPRPLRPDMERWFGKDKSRISRFSRAAMIHIFQSFNYTLSFQNDRLQPLIPLYAMKMALAIGMPSPEYHRVWGFVEGVYRFCLPPAGDTEVLFNGHYGGHGFKYQIVIAPNGMIEDCAGPYPGRDHDSFIAEQSDLNERLSEFCRTEYGDYAIYGDPAYAHDEFVFKPYDRALLTYHEAISSTLMSSARVAVEHAIGRVVANFPALDFLRTARAEQTHVGIKYMVAVILTNFLTCIRGSNQICDFFDCSPPSLEDFLGPRPRRPIRLVELDV